jgi:hypothetical protein
MYASNIYAIREATAADAAALSRLAELDSATPLSGRVVIGEIRGTAAAAVSVADDRVIADPFIPTAHLVAAEATPSLRERIVAALAPARRAAADAA